MICRLCLKNLTEESATPLFPNTDESELVKIIAKYLFLELTGADSISTNICHTCEEHLIDIDQFCKYVDEKQSTLRNEFLEVKCAFDVQVQMTGETYNDNNEESLLDIKDIITGTQVSEMPGEEFSCASFVDETGQLQDDISLSNPTQITKFTRERKCKRQKSVLVTKKSKMKVTKLLRPRKKCKIPLTRAKRSEVDVSTEQGNQLNESVDDENCGDDDVKSDELIANYLKLKCELCEVSMETFANLRTHFKNVHNCKGYMVCCGRRFKKRILLVEHIYIHLNPQHFQCKLCSKNLKSKNSLAMHMQNRHTRNEDLKYGCSICGKRFSCKNNLKHHILAHQTEKNFCCKICEKSFVTQYRLNAHMKAMHINRCSYICDFCGRKFKCKASFNQHVAEHQGIIREPPVQCNVCGEWFKQKYALTQHAKNHNAVGVECELCGRTCPTPRALKSHIRYHSRQSNLQCSFCDKTFKVKSNLQEHIATHTGEKHNLCPHCPKAFRSKANMYVHIKRDHFEEWSKKRSKIPPFPTVESTL